MKDNHFDRTQFVFFSLKIEKDVKYSIVSSYHHAICWSHLIAFFPRCFSFTLFWHIFHSFSECCKMRLLWFCTGNWEQWTVFLFIDYEHDVVYSHAFTLVQFSNTQIRFGINKWNALFWCGEWIAFTFCTSIRVDKWKSNTIAPMK